jgi:hypothetical protein
MLRELVPHVYCTENADMGTFPAATNEALRFLIGDDGEITLTAG